MDINRINVKFVEHLVSCEEKYRFNQHVQDFYKYTREHYPNVVTEDIIQRQIMKGHHICEPISDQELADYRTEISKYTHLPNVVSL